MRSPRATHPARPLLSMLAAAAVALALPACVDESECQSPGECPDVDVGDDDDDDDDDGDHDTTGSGRFPSDVPAGFALVDYGDVDVAAGETADLTFDAAEDVRNFFVVAEGEPRSFVIVLSARAPDGTEVIVAENDEANVVHDSYFGGFPGPSMSPNRVVGRPRASAALIPNTPRIAMTSGTWTFRVGMFRLESDDNDAPANVPLDGKVRVGVVTRAEEVPATGTIDLVISLHSSSGLDAGSAPGDVVLQEALGTVDEALGNVGVRVGGVSYLDLDEDVPQPLDLEGPSCLGGDIERVFDVVEPAPDAIHLVLVGGFTCIRLGGLLDAGQNLAAISNGVPGIPFSTRDGIVVATALKNDFPEDWALVLAHEIGHFLGLMHTEEGVRGVFDNIADTDDNATDDYLMFANVSQSKSTLVTPDQGRIIRAHPLVHPE